MAKRKLDEAPEHASASSPPKKHKHTATATTSGATVNFPDPSRDGIEACFSPELFESQRMEAERTKYSESTPYQHSTLHPLVSDALLEAVLAEIHSSLHFTPKTTDIYRIWQSGDLANLSGLDAAQAAALPALRALRDALYSERFRAFLSDVTGCGPLSGTRTDMAVNVYRPGCYLLCHDDVIGSRRVSYILYLTDKGWRAEWGGALRLYATETRARADGQPGTVKVPVEHHEAAHAIPPQWNQLAFFAVQPGESYHDVEEVYMPPPGPDAAAATAQRTRVAISGWFHLPQPGEPGYVAGHAQQLATESSLAQLQRSDVHADVPQPAPRAYAPSDDEWELSEADLDYLVRFISPQYLTPEAAEATAAAFAADSMVQLPCFLNRATATAWGTYVTSEPATQPQKMHGATAAPPWRVAGPPHKQRFLFQAAAEADVEAKPAHGSGTRKGKAAEAAHAAQPPWPALAALFASGAFRRWLRCATGLTPTAVDALLRRFRRGYDYQLAQNYAADEPRLEGTLGLTPGAAQIDDGQWWDPPAEDEDEDEDAEAEAGAEGGAGAAIAGAKTKTAPAAAGTADDATADDETADTGGEEIYMAGDDSGAPDSADTAAPAAAAAADAADSDADSFHGFSPSPPPSSDSDDEGNDNHTARSRARPAQSRAAPPRLPPTGAASASVADPAVYDAGSAAADDSLLHSNAPAWNVLALVLRDAGVLRAVRYVNAHAARDRWDVSVAWTVEDEDEEDDDDDE